LLSTRNRLAFAAAGLASAATMIASAPTGVASTCGGGSGGGGGIGPSALASATGGAGVTTAHRRHRHHRRHRTHRCAAAGYVNPIKGKAWWAGRTDMGVDYSVNRRKPIRAIGNAVILGSDNHSGWPGGHYLWYKLLDGDHAGYVIYVAETMGHLLPAGTHVAAGERIATAKPGGTGTEWGWSNRRGDPRAAPCYSEGMKTNSGREMARFLRHLGAPTADKPGPGPDYPAGKRC
jgi:hypothetical protein